jgi:hypothetical protein
MKILKKNSKSNSSFYIRRRLTLKIYENLKMRLCVTQTVYGNLRLGYSYYIPLLLLWSFMRTDNCECESGFLECTFLLAYLYLWHYIVVLHFNSLLTYIYFLLFVALMMH